MGQASSAELQKYYRNGKYKMLSVESDRVLGDFQTIGFGGDSEKRFLRQSVNLRYYDQTAETEAFVAKLGKECKQITNFLFASPSAANAELIEFVFEFGQSFESPIFKETHVWSTLQQMCEAMIFLEDENLHHPCLARRFVFHHDKHRVKVLNPFAFPEFRKEMVSVYLNPMVAVSKRKAYAQDRRRDNIRDFGLTVMTLLSRVSEQRLKSDPAFLMHALSVLVQSFSKHLGSFLTFLVKNTDEIQSFKEIREQLLRAQSGKQLICEAIGTVANPVPNRARTLQVSQQSITSSSSIPKDLLSLGPKENPTSLGSVTKLVKEKPCLFGSASELGKEKQSLFGSASEFGEDGINSTVTLTDENEPANPDIRGTIFTELTQHPPGTYTNAFSWSRYDPRSDQTPFLGRKIVIDNQSLPNNVSVQPNQTFAPNTISPTPNQTSVPPQAAYQPPNQMTSAPSNPPQESKPKTAQFRTFDAPPPTSKQPLVPPITVESYQGTQQRALPVPLQPPVPPVRISPPVQVTNLRQIRDSWDRPNTGYAFMTPDSYADLIDLTEMPIQNILPPVQEFPLISVPVSDVRSAALQNATPNDGNDSFLNFFNTHESGNLSRSEQATDPEQMPPTPSFQKRESLIWNKDNPDHAPVSYLAQPNLVESVQPLVRPDSKPTVQFLNHDEKAEVTDLTSFLMLKSEGLQNLRSSVLIGQVEASVIKLGGSDTHDALNKDPNISSGVSQKLPERLMVKDPEILKFFGKEEPDPTASSHTGSLGSSDPSASRLPTILRCSIDLLKMPEAEIMRNPAINETIDSKFLELSSKQQSSPSKESSETASPEPPSSEKEIARFVFKFIVSENRHKKIVEFTDGTSEDVPMTDAERQQLGLPVLSSVVPPGITPSKLISVSPEPIPDAPVAAENTQTNQSSPNTPFVAPPLSELPKNSAMGYYNVPEAVNLTASALLQPNILNFILVPTDDAPPLLLFKSRPIQENQRFPELKQLVEWREFLRPALYHDIMHIPREARVEAMPTNMDDGQILIRREDYLRA